jgi:uncharacterized protein
MDWRRSAIFDAIELGDMAAIAQLLRTDPSQVHARDHEGNTPLHAAVGFGALDATRLLLEQGADPNAQNDADETPLFGAPGLNSARLLVHYGANVNQRNSYRCNTPLS